MLPGFSVDEAIQYITPDPRGFFIDLLQLGDPLLDTECRGPDINIDRLPGNHFMKNDSAFEWSVCPDKRSEESRDDYFSSNSGYLSTSPEPCGWDLHAHGTTSDDEACVASSSSSSSGFVVYCQAPRTAHLEAFDTVLQQNIPRIPEDMRKQDKAKKWTKAEHTRFLAALDFCGCDNLSGTGPDGKLCVALGPGTAQRVAIIVGSRSVSQVRSHAQKHFRRIWRQAHG
jgi:hypothetical protein